MLQSRRFVIAVLVSCTTAAHAATIHVDDDGVNDPGPGDSAVSDPMEDGSVDHPYDAIQEAIDAASDTDVVLLEDGNYTGVGNRDISFGGKAIRVESVNGALLTTVDAEASGARGFLFNAAETIASELKGVTIVGVVLGDGIGGAIACTDSSPKITDCHILGNSVTGPGAAGAGVYATGGNPTLQGCLIQGNTVEDLSPAGLARGGGVRADAIVISSCDILANEVTATLSASGGGITLAGVTTLNDSRINGNSVTAASQIGSARGGGMIAQGGPVTMSDCTFDDNFVHGDSAWGGAIYAKGANADLSLTRVDLTNNEADSGAGLRAEAGAEVISYRCRFSGNTTHGSYTLEPAMYVCCLFNDNGTGLAHLNGGDVTNCTMTGNNIGMNAGNVGAVSIVRNCIVWDNTSLQISGSAVAATYSLVQGGFTGTGNVDGDPLFVDVPAGDYRPRRGGPAIDASLDSALPAWASEDLVGQIRRLDDFGTTDTGVGASPLADLGALEFEGFLIPGDATGDGYVDVNDLVMVISNWGKCLDQACPGNIVFSLPPLVDVNDLVSVIENWGSSDCNFNGIDDIDEMMDGLAADCNTNGLPDGCDIAHGTSEDCDDSGIPDECELDGNDCNMNGLLDSCETADGTTEDCNANGIPDDCELDGNDLNGNGVPDDCEYASADECASAAPLSTDTPRVFNLATATTGNPDEGSCFGAPDDLFRDIWFRWVAPCDGEATVSLCGSLFDTRLAVYISCPIVADQFIACNEDACGLQSEVTFLVGAGEVFRIRVGGAFDIGGIGVIEATCAPPE